MKKKLTFKTLCALLALVLIVTSLTLISSAASVNSFSEFDRQYTAVSDTYGYSSASFGGYYSATNSDNNYAYLSAESKGGATSDFLTTLYVQFDHPVIDFEGGGRIQKDSDAVGSGLVSHAYRPDSIPIPVNTTGYTEHHCTAKNNSSDTWYMNYYHDWMGVQQGWD